jgi:hypothetical protein
LQATALVHEAYLRLIGAETSQPWNSRGHFFAAAAETMRRILIERTRRKGRMKPTPRGLRWLSASGFTSSNGMQILSTIEAEQRSTNR